VHPLVTLGKQPAIKVQLFQIGVVHEHQNWPANESPIQSIVILVLSLVYHVKISAKQPGPDRTRRSSCNSSKNAGVSSSVDGPYTHFNYHSDPLKSA
jgi:hypothetical protein